MASLIYGTSISKSIPTTKAALPCQPCMMSSKARLSAMRYGYHIFDASVQLSQRTRSSRLLIFVVTPFQSSEIIRMFYTEFDDILPEKYQKVDLFPKHLQKDIEATNEWTYNDINNGVYKTGFAQYAQPPFPFFSSHPIPSQV